MNPQRAIAKEILLDEVDFQWCSCRSKRDMFRANGEQIDVLVQGFIMPDILQQGRRSDVGLL